MIRRTILAILLIASVGQNTASNTTHMVGDGLGWQIQPFFPLAYIAWAITRPFAVGDLLVFNFTTGRENVAMVTKESFLFCTSTNPISLETKGPANFSLYVVGEYYFISTIPLHCALGLKLAIYVTGGPPPSNISHFPPPPPGNISHSPPLPPGNPPPPLNVSPSPPSSTPSPSITEDHPFPPPPPPNLASAQVVGGFYINLLCIGAAMLLVC